MTGWPASWHALHPSIAFLSKPAMTDPMAAKGGRPPNYDGPEEPVANIIYQHLDKLVKDKAKRRGDFKLFNDAGDLASPKKDKIKPHLPMLMKLSKHSPNWKFGGPFQIKIVQKWNSRCKFHPQHGSREWAKAEVSKLWNMERILEDLASRPTEWQEFVEDIAVYPIPEKHTAQPQPSKPFEEECLDDGGDLSEVGTPQSSEKMARPRSFLPDWMMEDCEEMGLSTADTQEEFAETSNTEANTKGAPKTEKNSTDTQEEEETEAAPPATATPQEKEAAGATAAPETAADAAWQPDVEVQDGLPTCKTTEGNVLFGVFAESPSADGMAMAIFPGHPATEVAGMTFEMIPGTEKKQTKTGVRNANKKKKPAAKTAMTTPERRKQNRRRQRRAQQKEGLAKRARRRRPARRVRRAEHMSVTDRKGGQKKARRKPRFRPLPKKCASDRPQPAKSRSKRSMMLTRRRTWKRRRRRRSRRMRRRRRSGRMRRRRRRKKMKGRMMRRKRRKKNPRKKMRGVPRGQRF